MEIRGAARVQGGGLGLEPALFQGTCGIHGAVAASLTVNGPMLYPCKVLKETGGLQQASYTGVSQARDNGRKQEIRFKGIPISTAQTAWD